MPWRPKHNWSNKTHRESRQRAKMLDKGRENYFKYDMEEILEASTVPEEKRMSFTATLFAKGSRQDIDTAKDFVDAKTKEGFIEGDTAKSIVKLIDRYATWR
jgi:hypothetical protein